MANKIELIKKPYTVPKYLRWSALSCFEYNPDEWFMRYVLKKEQAPTKEMLFGTYVDERIQTDPDYLPQVPRYPLMQHKMEAKFGKLFLQGTADGVSLKPALLADYKTGKKAWDQKRIDDHGQLKMYLLLLWLTEKIRPEDFRVFIHWLETQDDWHTDTVSLINEEAIQTFETKITMQDLMHFGDRLNRVHKEMVAYVADKNMR